jgi:hypothetical protein
MQPDRAIFLSPPAPRTERGSVHVGADALPDVALEVDHTTDALCGKLAVYHAWGFPEVWVEVPTPDPKKPTVPSRYPPALTIHRRRGSSYRKVRTSVAFPGWTAQQIHRALNEDDQSPNTAKDLMRVAAVLAERYRTAPDDALRCDSQRDNQAASSVKGWEQSLELVEILESRKITLTKDLAERFDTIARMPMPTLIRAAFHCGDAADLVGRIDDWARGEDPANSGLDASQR